MKIQLVIFDLDGVIVNTDIYHFEAWKYVASQHSIQLDSSINERLKGLSRRDSWNLIMKTNNLHLKEKKVLKMILTIHLHLENYYRRTSAGFP